MLASIKPIRQLSDYDQFHNEHANLLLCRIIFPIHPFCSLNEVENWFRLSKFRRCAGLRFLVSDIPRSGFLCFTVNFKDFQHLVLSIFISHNTSSAWSNIV